MDVHQVGQLLDLKAPGEILPETTLQLIEREVSRAGLGMVHPDDIKSLVAEVRAWRKLDPEVMESMALLRGAIR